MMQHQVRAPAGARRARKRVGRGEASGHGKTSGRGTKGSGARQGPVIRRLTEGGQMPLFRRLPKRGFSNARFRTAVSVVNVGQLNERRLTGGEAGQDGPAHRVGESGEGGADLVVEIHLQCHG